MSKYTHIRLDLLRDSFPDRPEMHVTHETVYQALYVQGRGELRRELAEPLAEIAAVLDWASRAWKGSPGAGPHYAAKE